MSFLIITSQQWTDIWDSMSGCLFSEQGESGHCDPLSLPIQLWELKEYLIHPLSLPPLLKSPAYTLLHAKWS